MTALIIIAVLVLLAMEYGWAPKVTGVAIVKYQLGDRLTLLMDGSDYEILESRRRFHPNQVVPVSFRTGYLSGFISDLRLL